MKKLLVVLLVICILWIAKLSFDLHQLSAGQTALEAQQNGLQQSNASLNDQLAALNRRLSADGQQNSSQQNPEAHALGIQPAQIIQPAVLIGQQLDLVEFALHQQQYSLALDKLTQLDHQLEQYPLSPALKASLHQAADKDRQMLKQFINANTEQQNKIKAVLDQIDQSLAAEIKSQYTHPVPPADKSFWQRWIQIESVQQPNAVLMHRTIILKEAQLRLLLAQQLLQKGQYIAFQQELTLVLQTLKQLPDAKSQAIMQRLHDLKKIPAPAVPVLNTRALIG